MALSTAPLGAQEDAPTPDEAAPVETVEPAAPALVERAALPAGSHVPLRTVEEVSSKTARKGDLIKLEIAEDVLVEDRVVLLAGTPAVAELTRAEKKGWMGRAGKLEARILYIELPSGPVRLSGELGDAGKSNAGVATALSVVTGFGFVTGKSAVIPAGTELVARLDREARIPVEKALSPAS